MRTVLTETADSLQQCRNMAQGAKGSPTDLSLIARAIHACKLVNDSLQAPLVEDKKLLPTVESALDALQQPLKGTRTELEQLLLEASRLRRASASRVTAIIEKTPVRGYSCDQHHPQLACACIRSIFAVTHFLARYVAFKPPKKSSTASPQKSPKKCVPVSLVAQQSLKSTLAAVQINLTHGYVDWGPCIAALDSCLALSDALKEGCENRSGDDAVGKENAPSIRIKVSNVYWSRSLRQKDANAGPVDLLSTLRRSIHALEACTPAEKMIAFMAVKCERAAALCMEQVQFDRARQILQVGIDSHIQAGNLPVVAQAALSNHPQKPWGEANSEEFMLGRLLSMYSRLFLQQQSSPSVFSFYDGTKLKDEERGLILEKQFIALSETSIPESAYPRLKELAELVLCLYTNSAWSMHRLRFISRLLTFCSRNSILPTQFLPQTVMDICMDRTDEEPRMSEVGQSSPHRSLHLSILMQWEFQIGKPSLKLLHEFVACHVSLLDACKPSGSDHDLLIAQFNSVVDFTDMYGLGQLRLDALHCLRRLLELQAEPDLAALSSSSSQIGLHFTRMGLTRKAGRALAIAEGFLARSKSKTLIVLQWHLAYSEYLTALSSYEKAAEQLASAQSRYESDFSTDVDSGSRSTRLAQLKYLAQAAQVASKLAFESGNLEAAILNAKKSVKISVRQWSLLEKLLSATSASPKESDKASNDGELASRLSNMTLSAEQQSKNPLGKGAPFWAYVYSHFDGLIHLSRLSAHYGSFQDGIYYAEQAKKVGEAIGSDVFLCTASCVLALQLAQGGDFDGSQLAIGEAQSRWGSVDDAVCSLQALTAMARARLTRLEPVQLNEVLAQAEKLTSRIQASDCTGEESVVISEQPSKAISTVGVSRPRRPVASNAVKPRRTANKTSSRAGPIDTHGTSMDAPHSTNTSSLWIQRTRTELSLLLSCLQIRSGLDEEAKGLLSRIQSLARSADDEVWYRVQQARLMLAEATRLLQSDAVYSVLPESTIAYPTRNQRQSADPQKKTGDPMGATSGALAATSRVERKATKKQPSSQDKSSRAGEIVDQARELLRTRLASMQPMAMSSAANEFSDVLIRSELLSSILSSSMDPSPLLVASHLNAPKSLRWSREAASLRADVVLGDKSSAFLWPAMNEADKKSATASIQVVDNVSLQQQLMHDLPPSWAVVTVALNDDRNEMYLSKIRSGQSPFLLRLPLHRTSSDGLHEDTFEFDTAKRELLDIIARANSTAHDTKGRSDKKAKKEWWAAREALDQRLMLLLKNVETFWLGGFRGILSNYRADPHQLSRFSGSLCRILDQHLPSRRKSRTRTTTTTTKTKSRVQLHSHVAELFVGLGNPDDADLDDCITDLVYFVIDVLQFQGELNAYDEVDFDVMVVEIADALRSYHDAAQSVSEQQRGHTVLILDKALHSLPWESLPCLQSQSISRMPSLNSLYDLVSRMRLPTTKTATANPGLHIDVERGAYILNPSSDLASTQQTFLDRFQATLTKYDYRAIVNRAPSEAEFQSCLQDHDLCLYFGHGSGGQFIRGRTVRRLPRCAVTFLMGCSSSRMVECGRFESYGTPDNYLRAGSAAVLGTLWDVTDRDIDRFAVQTLVRWGFLRHRRPAPAPAAVVASGDDGDGDDGDDHKSEDDKTTKSQIRRGKYDVNVNDDGEEKGDEEEEDSKQQPALGLDDAVARSRDACLLRYLNGAAPVIYGIPVFLN